VILDQLNGYHSSAQQSGTGAAIHGSFECLESVNLTFGLAIAPPFGANSYNGCIQAVEASAMTVNRGTKPKWVYGEV